LQVGISNVEFSFNLPVVLFGRLRQCFKDRGTSLLLHLLPLFFPFFIADMQT
jgi:hypothetical protein